MSLTFESETKRKNNLISLPKNIYFAESKSKYKFIQMSRYLRVGIFAQINKFV